MDLDQLTKIVRLTHQTQQIKRAMLAVGEDRHENDLEHSSQLALVAWFLADSDNLKLNLARITQLALVHDLLEVHAGDTYAYASQKHLNTQPKRELQAIATLKSDWPNVPSMHQAIAEYEACETPEAKYVYSLDKLITIINNIADHGRSWRQEGVTLDQVKRAKTGKADRSPFVAPYFHAAMKKLEHSPELFNRSS